MSMDLRICLKIYDLGLHRSGCGRWTESYLRNVSSWPGTFLWKEPGTKKFGQDIVLLLQCLSMWLCMVSLRKEQRGERGWGSRGRSINSSCLEVQQRLKLLMSLLQKMHSLDLLVQHTWLPYLGQSVSLWNFFFRSFMSILEHPRELSWFPSPAGCPCLHSSGGLVLAWPSLMDK